MNDEGILAAELSAGHTEDISIEDLTDATGGSFCLGTVGCAGCPSSAGSVGTASSH